MGQDLNNAHPKKTLLNTANIRKEAESLPKADQLYVNQTRKIPKKRTFKHGKRNKKKNRYTQAPNTRKKVQHIQQEKTDHISHQKVHIAARKNTKKKTNFHTW